MIAVPLVPTMVPELSMVLPMSGSRMPTLPEMVPELVTLATLATMPAPVASPEMVPALATLAVVAIIPSAPEMRPELAATWQISP